VVKLDIRQDDPINASLYTIMDTMSINDGLAKAVNLKSNNLAEKVVMLIENGGFESTTSQKRAREIMRDNFFGVKEAIKPGQSH
jgi:hypothetical protein